MKGEKAEPSGAMAGQSRLRSWERALLAPTWLLGVVIARQKGARQQGASRRSIISRWSACRFRRPKTNQSRRLVDIGLDICTIELLDRDLRSVAHPAARFQVSNVALVRVMVGRDDVNVGHPIQDASLDRAQFHRAPHFYVLVFGGQPRDGDGVQVTVGEGPDAACDNRGLDA